VGRDSGVAKLLALAQRLYPAESSNHIPLRDEVGIPILSEQEGGALSKGNGIVLGQLVT
jgi:hypothetical protein